MGNVITTQYSRSRSGVARCAPRSGDLTSIDGQQSLPGVVATVGKRLRDVDAVRRPTATTTSARGKLGSEQRRQTDKLNLRKGVQFHDGRELTSDDINYSLLRVRDPKLAAIAGQLASQSAWWTSISMPDKYTIVLGSDVPRPGVFDFLQYFTIVDKNLMESPDAATKANGTGPFAFVGWISGDHVTMQRNPNYWDGTLPYVDTLQTRIFRVSRTCHFRPRRPPMTPAAASCTPTISTRRNRYVRRPESTTRISSSFTPARRLAT